MNERGIALQPVSDRAAKVIEELSRDLQPVRRIQMSRAFALLLLFEVLAAAIGIWAFGVRPDIQERLGEPGFLLLVAFLAVAAAASAWAALRAAIPGLEIGRVKEVLLLLSPVVLSAVMLFTESAEAHWNDWTTFFTGCWKCTVLTAVSAATPWLVAVVLLRRFAPLVALRVAMFAGFSAFFVGGFVTQLHCPLSSGVHLAFAHFLPIALLSAVACGATAALLRPSDR